MASSHQFLEQKETKEFDHLPGLLNDFINAATTLKEQIANLSNIKSIYETAKQESIAKYQLPIKKFEENFKNADRNGMSTFNNFCRSIGPQNFYHLFVKPDSESKSTSTSLQFENCPPYQAVAQAITLERYVTRLTSEDKEEAIDINQLPESHKPYIKLMQSEVRFYQIQKQKLEGIIAQGGPAVGGINPQEEKDFLTYWDKFIQDFTNLMEQIPVTEITTTIQGIFSDSLPNLASLPIPLVLKQIQEIRTQLSASRSVIGENQPYRSYEDFLTYEFDDSLKDMLPLAITSFAFFFTLLKAEQEDPYFHSQYQSFSDNSTQVYKALNDIKTQISSSTPTGILGAMNNFISYLNQTGKELEKLVKYQNALIDDNDHNEAPSGTSTTSRVLNNPFVLFDRQHKLKSSSTPAAPLPSPFSFNKK